MEAVRLPKLHERVAASLAREIVSGRLEQGAELPSEANLAASFGVSKTVAREASQLLAAHGLIRIRHGKRSTVRERGDWEILSPAVQRAYAEEGLASTFVPELYDVRMLLEPQAARAAAEARDPELVAAIERILREMRERAGAPDAEFLSLDRDFHLAILGALTPNRILAAMLRDVNSLLRTNWALIDLSREHGEVLAQHAGIAAAIRAGNGAAAEAAMGRHLEWARERFELASGDRARTG